MAITLKGVDLVVQNLAKLGGELQTDGAAALFEIGEEIMGESKAQYVPVDEGILRASGHVELPRVDGETVSVVLGFGGAAAAYALIQHENLTYHHGVGGAKYLERPILARATSLEADLAAKIKARTGL